MKILFFPKLQVYRLNVGPHFIEKKHKTVYVLHLCVYLTGVLRHTPEYFIYTPGAGILWW